MKILVLALTMLFATASFAGFKAYNGTTDLGLVQAVKCSTGLSCTKVGTKAVITARVLEEVLTPATGATLTGAQCGSTVLNSPSAVSLTLPTGAASLIGCKFKFILNYSSGITIDPDASSIIFGMASTAGDRVLNSTKGSILELVYSGTNIWMPNPSTVSGAVGGANWTDNN